MKTSAALLLFLCACSAPRDAEPVTAAPAGEPRVVELQGVTVHIDERYVEMSGTICLREGLLELIATLPSGKEHESIVSLAVRPSNLHAGLLMLGLKPGKPGEWRYYEDRVETIDPTGDRVRVTLLYEKDGRWVEEPIEKFVVDYKGGRLPGSEFVFAGSRLVEPREGGDASVYVADETGDLISLVCFGTEVLAWPKAASDSNDELIWLADPKLIPELGAQVKLRIYPAHEKKE